ncbi:MAG TPA: ATP-binding protein [Ktedonobacteraceae bacterium]|nr:ATP-binding protein [Ktedonobacteraceae bacterium]
MVHVARRSLLVQLLSVYLLFVVVVLIAGVGVNTLIEQKVRSDAQAADQALAQEIALVTSLQLRDAESALVALGSLARQDKTPEAMMRTFQAWQSARGDVDYVYWLDPLGGLRVSWPQNNAGIGSEFSPPDIVQNARIASGPVFDVGIAAETSLNAGVIIADPVRASNGTLLGIVAANISLVDLSEPLSTVVQAQQSLGRHLMISIIDDRGELIATPDHRRILETVQDQLPGADAALQGQVASRIGPGSDGQDWLFSAVPVPGAGWAVIVQRPASEALAVVTQLHLWLLTAALLFAVGGLLFWLILLSRVIRPLHTLAIEHQSLPTSEQALPVETTELAERADEVGDLARSLVRLERDGLEKLGELRTLLETSNAVVGSLEPRAVVSKIIREAQRIVDVQAAAVLLPDEQGVLRVLVSEGHDEHYNQMLALPPENASSSAVQALHSNKPVQKLLRPGETWPVLSYDEGFRAVLAIPIISRHAGGVVLLVHRTEPHPFEPNEIDLLLTFANYATLAWEHAVLYERSDERLREVAQENERLYRQASEEKQKLEAIMGSMSDGLVLTGIDGMVLYANQGASAIVGLASEALVRRPIDVLYAALQSDAVDAAACERVLAQAESSAELVVEIRRDDRRHVIHLRLFDVDDEAGQPIGRGLLLRDVTRERELDEFKTTLLAAVGHEVRTPLAAIKGYTSTLLQGDVVWSLADQQYFLQTISDEADRLAQLVSNLLDLSRQEAGLLLLNRMPASVKVLMEKVVERLRQPGQVITLSLPDDLPLVDVDSGRIEVVFHNLIANALVYGDGEVRISAARRDAMLVVSIADNGPGIAVGELPYVFERFYRAQHGRQQRSGGTGLGLTICKAFIEAHGGTIWVESDARDTRGTTFSFSLPLALPVVSSRQTAKLPAEISTGERGSV